jgi:hypothetical protein
MRAAVEIEIEDRSTDIITNAVVVVVEEEEEEVNFRGVGVSTRENQSGSYHMIDDVKCTLIVL